MTDPGLPTAATDHALIVSLLQVASTPEAVALGSTHPSARLYRVRTADGRLLAVKVVAADAVEHVRTAYEAAASRLPADGPPAQRPTPTAVAGGAAPVVPGLVPLIGSGTRGAVGWLIMPWLPGTLADLATATPVAAPALADVLGPVATGLDALHRAGYVHGDVTPANVLLVARSDGAGGGLLGDLDSIAPVGTVATRHTPAFAAPETLRGAESSTGNDVYSLAATVVAALTGPPAATRTLRENLESLTTPGIDLAVLRTATVTDLRRRRADVRAVVAALAAPSPAPAPIAPVPAAAPQPVARPVATVVRPLAVVPDLEASAVEFFGLLDPRQPTADRLPLRFTTDPEPIADDDETRPVWRRPAFVVSVLVAVLLIVGVLVYELL